MNQETLDTISGIATAVFPAIVTIITFFQQSRLTRKHAAKQSILQMIMEDQFNWELFRKFPVNYGNIQNEYREYHKCGGNGEVTKKVDEYKEWYKANEDKMLEMSNYSCSTELTRVCRKKPQKTSN